MSELSLCPVWWLLCTDVLGTLMIAEKAPNATAAVLRNQLS